MAMKKSLRILTWNPKGFIEWTIGQCESDIIILKLRIITSLSPLGSLFSYFSFFLLLPFFFWNAHHFTPST